MSKEYTASGSPNKNWAEVDFAQMLKHKAVKLVGFIQTKKKSGILWTKRVMSSMVLSPRPDESFT